MTIQLVSVGNNTNRSLIDFYHYLNKKLDAKKEIVEARQTAMFLCRHILDSSLSSVGIYFGGRDHTTVMHAIKTVEKKQKEKIKIKDNIAQITQELSFVSF